MRGWWSVLVLLFLTVGSFALVLQADEPVTLRTWRGAIVGVAPQTVRFRAAVRPDAHNRQLCFTWDSDASSGESCMTLDGDTAPVSYWKDITFRTEGEFHVYAWVARNDGHTLLSNIVIIRVLRRGV